MTITELFGEPIHTYTRRQAIEDGVLVDLMQEETVDAVREARFKIPVAITAEAFFQTIALTPKDVIQRVMRRGRQPGGSTRSVPCRKTPKSSGIH